jgi:hypothetical protein
MGVFYGQSMHVVSGVVRQEFRRLVDSHVINSTLHWAKVKKSSIGGKQYLDYL